MRSLRTGLTVQRATSAAATLADIERNFIAKRHRLKGAVIVQRFASISARTGAIGCVIAGMLAELRHSARMSAA
jgi:hypothetical protein